MKPWNFLLTVLSMIIILVLVTYLSDSYLDSNLSILSFDDSIKERVKDKGIGAHRGTVLFLFESGKKIEISPRYRKDEPLQNVHLLRDFIQTGDSIFKRKHSDTVFILRKDTKYIFFINKVK